LFDVHTRGHKRTIWTSAGTLATVSEGAWQALGFTSKEFDHMDETKHGIQSIDDYIKTFPVEVQKKLQSIRKLIRKLAPEAEEKISYQIPTFYLNGNLVHFAGFKNHIGFYPTPERHKFIRKRTIEV